MNRLIREIEKRKTLLRKIIFMIQKEHDEKTEGRLRISKGRFFQVTEESGRNGYYIRKDNMQLVKSLAQKDYDQDVLKCAEAELRSLEKGCIYTGRTFEDVYEGLSDIRKKLIRTAYLPDAVFVRIWLDRPYEKFGFKDDAPNYRTGRGVRVRSKSEWIIASILEKYNVPYLYEYPVAIDGRIYRPVFVKRGQNFCQKYVILLFSAVIAVNITKLPKTSGAYYEKQTKEKKYKSVFCRIFRRPF